MFKKEPVHVQGTQPDFLSGGGEMGELIRSYDWANTSLGIPEKWPYSLKTIVRIMLTSQQPIWIGWGPELIKLYNDPYRAIVGGKHPWALGKPALEVWRDIKEAVSPRLEKVKQNEGTYDEALLLVMERYGYPEETYYTFSYSPIPDDGGEIGGVFCANTDDTDRIIGERQLALLRELASKTVHSKTLLDIYGMSAEALETNKKDLPFAMLYLFENKEDELRLAASAGIEPGHDAAPNKAKLLDESKWPFNEVISQNKTVIVRNLQRRHRELPMGDWDRPPNQAAVLPILPSGYSKPIGVFVVALNPLRLYNQSYESFIHLVAGQIAANIANVKAFEDEKKRSEALAEIDRAKTVFFSNVSHEFRTPLTLMMGPLEDALHDTSIPIEGRNRVEIAHRNALRLLKLVNNLLDFSRIEAGRIQASFQPTDLAKFTAELVSNFQSAIEKAGLQLKITLPPTKEPIYVDHDMWEKIILNLLSNAFKFTFEGEIEVSLQEHHNSVTVKVSDTGTGIPEKDLPHLFQRFHRVEGARSRSFEGSGIGLSLVHELIQLHGGTISVESKEGKGSTFTLTLPKGKSHLPEGKTGNGKTLVQSTQRIDTYKEEIAQWLPESSATKENTANTNMGSVKIPSKPLILLADDNADMREYVSRLLQASYHVKAVANGKLALQQIEESRPDLILSDVMMPEMDGFQLLQALKGNPNTTNIPFILLSARAGEEATVEGMGAGADDYVVKPFSSKELLSRIDSAIKISKTRQSAAETLRNTFMHTPVAICLLKGPDMVIELANDSALEIWGRTSEEVLYKSAFVAMPELIDQGFKEILGNVYRTGEKFVANEAALTLTRHGKPELVYINFFYIPIRNTSGEIEGIVGVGYDVTELVKSRKDIKESESRYRKMAIELHEAKEQLQMAISSASISTWHWEIQEDKVYADELFIQLFGLSQEEGTTGVSMARFLQALHPDDIEKVNQLIQESIDSGNNYEAEYRIKSEGDSWRWVIARGKVKYDETGKAISFPGVLLDITERKRAQEALEKTNKELRMINNDLDNFIYTASHDLKAPVSNLEGLFYALVEEVENNPQVDNLRSMIDASFDRFKTTILDLTEITKAQKDSKEDLSLLSFSEVVDDVRSDIKDQIEKSNAKITTIFEVETLRFSRKNLRSVVYNLISNAIKYSHPQRDPDIQIRTKEQGDYVLLSVSDNGLGIPEGSRDKMFKMFKRLHSHVEGSGVGLYIVKRIIENAEGKIEIESEEGVGTMFKLYFKK